MNDLDRAHEHRTDPAPEPLKLGWYRSQRGTSWHPLRVEAVAIVDHKACREPLVVYWTLPGNPRTVAALPQAAFRERFVRLPENVQ